MADKIIKDWSVEVQVILKETTELAQNSRLTEALEQLFIIEKQTRTSADLSSNTKILVQIISLCYHQNEFKLLNENIVLLSKKRALLKQAITDMVHEAATYVDLIQDMTLKLELIDTLRTVTDGKVNIFILSQDLCRSGESSINTHSRKYEGEGGKDSRSSRIATGFTSGNLWIDGEARED